jgi:hypothetical protein
VAGPETLSAYPWVVVRLCCDVCGRKGGYRLARLAARYGPERPLLEVLGALSADCSVRDLSRYDHAQGWRDGCGARFADLGPIKPPPDLLPDLRRLRLIEGGASSPATRPPGHVPRSARNPRRAYDQDGREIRPVTIAAARAQGVAGVTVYCQELGCAHEARIDVSSWPGEIFVPDIALRLRTLSRNAGP